MFLTDSKFYVPVKSGFISKDAVGLVNATQVELLNYGYILSVDLIRALLTSENLEADCKKLREKLTVGKLNRPLFANWERRQFFSQGEFVIQIFGYMFQFSGNDLYDPQFMNRLLRNVDIKAFKEITLATQLELNDVVNSLAQSSTPLSKTQLRLVAEGAQYTGTFRFKNQEAKAFVMVEAAKITPLAQVLRHFRANPHDVLRYAAVKADPEQVNLPQEVKYSNLNWQERKALVEYLNLLAREDFEDVCEKMGLNRNAWERFARHFKVLRQENFEKYEYALVAFYASLGSKVEVVRGNARSLIKKLSFKGVLEVSDIVQYRTFASRIKSAIDRGDYDETMNLVSQKPGYLMRNLQTVLRVVDVGHTYDFLSIVSEALKTASPANLFSLMRINVDSSYRIIDANGLTTVQPADYPPVFRFVQEKAANEIRRRWGVAGTVVVDPSVQGKLVPSQSRNTEMERGTTVDIGNDDYVYFFMNWVESGRRTDLDHSYMIFDDNWNSEVVYFGRQANQFITQSGDFTSAPAPSGATEYGRINMRNIPRNARYIAPIINVYSGDAFDKLKTAYAGFFSSNSANFKLQQEFVRYNLTGNSQANVPFVFDLLERKLIVTDINFRESMGWTAHGYEEKVAQIVQAIKSQNTLTIAKLAKLLSGPTRSVSMYITDGQHDPANNQFAYQELHSLFNES